MTTVKQVALWGVGAVTLAAVAALTYWGVSSLNSEEQENLSLPPEKVAEYVHAVIEASRTVYTKNVVDKMQEKGIVVAAEHWRQQNALPLPAQFLMDSGRLVAEKGSGIKFRLASLWPIYVWNAPATEFERQGLEAVAKNPSRPYSGFVRIGRDRYFQAIYADLAISHACVDCHNSHMNSPRRDFKLNDVMGGIVISIPVGQ
ncbi:Tll0287-like domain-containing protein [Nitrospira sp. Kam-Ns4a]